MKYQAQGQTISSFTTFNCWFFFSILCIFHQFLSMLWSITFPFAREKCKIAENKCPELPQSAASEGGGLF